MVAALCYIQNKCGRKVVGLAKTQKSISDLAAWTAADRGVDSFVVCVYDSEMELNIISNIEPAMRVTTSFYVVSARECLSKFSKDSIHNPSIGLSSLLPMRLVRWLD